ncbi:energy-coupling factor ABC transporter permease [Maritalea sp.]|uniref:energy-coupling factor ABC transporter permease n=1 Tax=Maritalea sp. TaxID=2003361 RepID=UPI003EF9B146
MHIEPSIVDGAKITLSYATATGALGYSAKLAWDMVKTDGAMSLAVRSVLTTAMVFFYFQVLPHHPVGVSEVHLIMGSTLFLLFGAAPAAIGLMAGLLLQGMLFAPIDLPQFGMNVTTLLVPLFAMAAIAQKIIPAKTAYKDIGYGQALQLSTLYQGGIVAWVMFWAFYGQGFGAANMANTLTFGAAYMSVIIIEPLVDLAVLAGVKTLSGLKDNGLFEKRLYASA